MSRVDAGVLEIHMILFYMGNWVRKTLGGLFISQVMTFYCTIIIIPSKVYMSFVWNGDLFGYFSLPCTS